MGILDLPPELLLHIARFLVQDAHAAQEYQHHVFPNERFDVLASLSLTHSGLRKTCVAAGMFTGIRPRSGSLPLDDTSGNRELPLEQSPPLLISHFSRFGVPHLNALVIDLMNPDVWLYCRQLMEHFPGIKELGMVGRTNAVLDNELVETFEGSETGLKYQLSRFRGDTLSFKHLHLSVTALRVLAYVPRQAITTLILEHSSLDLEEWVICEMCKIPSFPALKRVSFTGNDLADFPFSTARQNKLARVFFSGAGMTHFAVSSGCTLGDSQQVDGLWFSSLLFLVDMLRTSSLDTLEVFQHTDELSAAYLSRPLAHKVDYPSVKFTKPRRLWFRCRDVESVLGPQTDTPFLEICNYYAPPAAPSPSSSSYHAWEYLETFLALFAGSNALLIEAPSAFAAARQSWAWRQFALGMSSTIGTSRWDARDLGDVIIGNKMYEYWGMRRIGSNPLVGSAEIKFLVWNHRPLTAPECRNILGI
jgi:hypothetical protein